MSKNAKSYKEPTHEEIALCAQSIYEREGRPQGRATQHWLQAEAQLIAERKAATGDSAQAKSAPKASAQPAKMRGDNWQTSNRQNVHTN